jgi:MerR family copper efflux transcriptional regulator
VRWKVKGTVAAMRIGALAAASGATAKTIRFYEQAGLLPAPPRTPAGYRDYPPGTRGRLEFIRAAQAAGLSLAEIRGILAVRDHGEPPCTHVTALLRTHLDQTEQRLAELTATRDMLRDLLTTAGATDPGTCRGSICRILDPAAGDRTGP